MPTLALSRSSPTNNTLMDLSSAIVYEVSTPFSFRSSTTTITRNGQVLATIKWGVLHHSELTMGGMTAPLNQVFPRASKLSESRVFTTSGGERLKWKDKSKLYCVSADSGFPLATYDYKLSATLRGKQPTLDIAPEAAHLTDILVVTWVIAKKKAEERRSAAAGSASAASSSGAAAAAC